MIGSRSVLKRFDRSKEVTIHINASSHALDAVLMQNRKWSSPLNL